MTSTYPYANRDISHANKLALGRWKLLRNAIVDHNVSTEAGSKTAFTSFGLLQLEPNDEKEGNGWYNVQLCTGHCFRIHLMPSVISLNDLTGFNNTGNVCIWPSEEVLAYYCVKHADNLLPCGNMKVCELGGGMTCLAASALLTAISKPVTVALTDGNDASVKNLNKIIKENAQFHSSCDKVVHVCRLRWDIEDDVNQMVAHFGQFDLVLLADCIFFVEFHEALVNTLLSITKNGGRVLSMAPKRGDTLDKFVERVSACPKFQVIQSTLQYDDVVWQKHCHFTSTQTYNPDLHYPWLIELIRCDN